MSDSTTANMGADPVRWPWLALGFRPFYLAGAAFAALAVPLWLAMFFGGIRFDGYLTGVNWHSHEMVFGFASAVIAGFLLTAVRNWTALPTPTGPGLAVLVVVWALGRIATFTGPANVAALIDLAFLPLLGVVIAVPIWRSRNVRNVKLLLVLGGLTLTNALYHFAHLGTIPIEWSRTSITVALDLITVLMAIIGGRVIPAFAANAIPGSTPRRVAVIEAIAIAALIAILVVDIVDVWIDIPDWIWLALLATAALAHGMRWLLWKPHQMLKDALLWMLPVAYVWIPVSLALRVFSVQSSMPAAVSVHALTLGAIGGLMLAMMMRSTLGHTGRALRAGRMEIAAFVLVQLAAVVRVIGTVVDPDLYISAVLGSGILWSLAFAVLLVRYAPMLIRARIDGLPG